MIKEFVIYAVLTLNDGSGSVAQVSNLKMDYQTCRVTLSAYNDGSYTSTDTNKVGDRVLIGDPLTAKIVDNIHYYCVEKKEDKK